MADTTLARRALIIGAAVLSVVLIGFMVTTMLVGTRVYPCESCHAMDSFAQSTQTTAHSSVECLTCHAGASLGDALDLRRRVLTQMIPSASIGHSEIEGTTNQLSSDACLACHEAVLDLDVGDAGIAIEHRACAAMDPCTSCHGATAHAQAVLWVRQYSMEECIVCHKASGASDLCDACHMSKSERDRLAVGPWQVTHGPNWRDTHGMGSVEYCSTCHPSTYCVDCHGTPLPHAANWGTLHGADAKSDRDGCGTCHPGESLCDSCHGMEMPHPAGFLERHSDLASGVEDSRCATCHIAEDCIECHENHVHPGGPNMPTAPATSDGED